MQKMSKLQQIAKYVKNNSEKFGRLNELVEYCRKQGLSAEETEFIKLFINDRIIIL